MQAASEMQKWHRPEERIDAILARLNHVWHYYPGYSLGAMVEQIVFFANVTKSNLPKMEFGQIEDIVYPKGHYLHETRNLEMGLAWLEEAHKDEPLPPQPIATAQLDRLATAWRKRPDMRLGQFLEYLGNLNELKSQSA